MDKKIRCLNAFVAQLSDFPVSCTALPDADCTFSMREMFAWKSRNGQNFGRESAIIFYCKFYN